MATIRDIFFMGLAVEEAQKYIGQTAPNPPVGACVVKDGKLLSIGAHKCAGTPHAEVHAILRAQEEWGKDSTQGATLYVTLEPCDHFGKTPPCTDFILKNGITKLVYGTQDTNPQVAGNGAEKLARSGVKVERSVLERQCKHLISAFEKYKKSGLPWVVHKLAFRDDGNMLPPLGKSTFTSDESLKRAHLERKYSDAILTTVKTIRADNPEFTVRHVQDYTGKKRILAVVSRNQINHDSPWDAWEERQKKLGFVIQEYKSFEEALSSLGNQNCLRVLVEAGPTFSSYIIENDLWDERLIFTKTSHHDNFNHEFRGQI